jgi:hypothetical protein
MAGRFSAKMNLSFICGTFICPEPLTNVNPLFSFKLICDALPIGRAVPRLFDIGNRLKPCHPENRAVCGSKDLNWLSNQGLKFDCLVRSRQ